VTGTVGNFQRQDTIRLHRDKTEAQGDQGPDPRTKTRTQVSDKDDLGPGHTAEVLTKTYQPEPA
jgi:hypothetical protein